MRDALILSMLDRLGFAMREIRPLGPDGQNGISITEFTRAGSLIKVVDVTAKGRLWWGYFEQGKKIREGDALNSLSLELFHRFDGQIKSTA